MLFFVIPYPHSFPLFQICDLGLQMAAAQASTADLERVFSSMGLVWSKLRSRMSSERAHKLTFVNHCLNHYAADSESEFEESENEN